jgi:sigma-E factor negative regulatory protein RseA
MNKQHSPEPLSAFLDDELEYHESLSLVSRLQSDPELSAKLHRFAVAKAFMHTPQPLIPDAGFVDRIHEALSNEPVVLAPRAVRHKLREKVATLSLAASIAMLAVMVGRSLNQYSPLEAGEMLAQVELNAPTLKASMEPELRDYLTMHNESAYLAGAQGMLPSIRLVSGSASR